MHNKSCSSITLLAATLALAALPASAGVVEYTDPTNTTWLSAVAASTQTAITFGSDVAGNYSSSYTTGALTFTGNPIIFGSGTANSLFSDYDLFGLGTVNIAISGASNVYVLGLWEACTANCGIYDNQILAATTTQAATQVGDSTVSWYQNSNKLFFGFVSDAPITGITITSNDGLVPNIALGNITYGVDTPSDTPEAATLLLIGSGLGVIARFRRYAPNLLTRA